MRVIIKGGVWTNAEDEILKAGVMKYGLYEWGKVASMLPRKSARACKARWYQWLDPRIKKGEWTREEEEKLLHLARLPTRWQTIAHYLHRTAAQCLEHYQHLLDAAEGKEEGDGEGGLRPGEIDPNPEAKPARPDPVDLNEEEQDMLMEARARLANTRGKKAKRKAREKQLEDARRLSSMQKARELRAAGIEVRRKSAKYRKGYLGGMDLSREIAFEQSAPVGFYDTSADDARARREMEEARGSGFRTKKLSELEGRDRHLEAKAIRRQLRQRAALDAGKDLAGSIAKEIGGVVGEEEEELVEEERRRKRRKLVLPAAQVSDAELEEVARLGRQSAAAAAIASSIGKKDASGSTLVGDYTRSALLSQFTPAAHPTSSSSSSSSSSHLPTRTPLQPDTITEEARRHAQARSAKTLADTPHFPPSSSATTTTTTTTTTTHHPSASASAASSSSSSSSTSAHVVGATPNPIRGVLEDRGRQARRGVLLGLGGMMRGEGAGGREEGEEDEDDVGSVVSGVSRGGASVASSALFAGRGLSAVPSVLRAAVKKALASLPPPQSDYELAPVVDEEVGSESKRSGEKSEGSEVVVERDEEEIEEERRKEAEEAEKRALLRKPRAQVWHLEESQRSAVSHSLASLHPLHPLPSVRPSMVGNAMPLFPSKDATVDRLIQMAMIDTLQSVGKFETQELEEARQMVQEEAEKSTSTLGSFDALTRALLQPFLSPTSTTSKPPLVVPDGKGGVVIGDGEEVGKGLLQEWHRKLCVELDKELSKARALEERSLHREKHHRDRVALTTTKLAEVSQEASAANIRNAALASLAEAEVEAIPRRKEAELAFLQFEQDRMDALLREIASLEEEKKKLSMCAEEAKM